MKTVVIVRHKQFITVHCLLPVTDSQFKDAEYTVSYAVCEPMNIRVNILSVVVRSRCEAQLGCTAACSAALPPFPLIGSPFTNANEMGAWNTESPLCLVFLTYAFH